MDAAAERVFFEVHRRLPQEAPGSDASTRRALSLLPPLPAEPEVLDVGCGPGRQTLELLRGTGGRVTAVDTHPPYLADLTRRAEAEGLGGRLRATEADMTRLPFADASFDLLWSEGAIYLMGVAPALKAWRRLLRPGACIAFTEIAWLTEDRPEEARRVWDEGYPAMTTVDGNSRLIASAGYEELARFVLPESDWWDYYRPIGARLSGLRRRYAGDPAALAVLDAETREIELYRAHSRAYGYAFFIVRPRLFC